MKLRILNPNMLDKFLLKYFSLHITKINKGQIGRYFMGAGFLLGLIIGVIL